MIKLENINVKIDGNTILEDINLNIEKGDFFAILGPNGGGKTTLIKIILGLLKPSSGKIIKKDNINIGYVPQFNTFNKHFPINVYDVILSGRFDGTFKLFKKYNEEDNKKVMEVIEKLGIEKLENRNISELSGGETQKILIARALVAEPDLIILDEPTASLDKASKTEIYEHLNNINNEVTIVIVSHDTHVISKYTEKIFCINKNAHCHINTKEHFEDVYGENMEIIKHVHLEEHDK